MPVRAPLRLPLMLLECVPLDLVALVVLPLLGFELLALRVVRLLLGQGLGNREQLFLVELGWLQRL